MPVAVKKLYDTLNDAYRQMADNYIEQLVVLQERAAAEKSKFVDLDFLAEDSHNSMHFSKPKKWTREELYDRGF